MFSMNPPIARRNRAGRPQADLDKVLRRERCRADRTGGEFCLLVFTTAAGTIDHAPEPLVQFLEKRSRCIDEVGCDAAGHVWFLMSGCPVREARRVGKQICSRVAANGSAWHCDVYHHASESTSTSLSNRRGSNGNGAREEDSRFAGGRPQESSRQTALELSRQTATEEEESPAKSTGELFLCETPLWKRSFDVLGAGLGLVCLAPLLLLIGLVVKFTSPGPAMFVQWRSGHGGRPFRIFKFRSMISDAPALKSSLLSGNERDGPAFKIIDDPRSTPLGRILRLTNLDELPQLWNVLRGEMSLVGPRPLPCDESAACAPWQSARLDVKPGLTCFWQSADHRETIPFDEWMRMDLRYAASLSPLVDATLVLRTLVKMLAVSG